MGKTNSTRPPQPDRRHHHPHRPRYQPPDAPSHYTIDLKASATQTAFMMSDAETAIFMGPRGEGKTTAGILGMLVHAQRQPPEAYPIVWAVVRDTWVYLRDTTIASIKRLLPANVASFWKDQDRICEIPPFLKILFFGMDQPADANRFQSLELGGLWLEEPAPAADVATGLPAEVYGIGMTSLRQLEPFIKRGLTAQHRAQITMNPPDEDHWVLNLEDLPGVAIYRAAPGEITSDEYRRRNEQALLAAGRQDLITRLVEGQVGHIQVGLAVTPEFSDAMHVTDGLPILSGVTVHRWWDFGLNPTCIWAQMTPMRRLHILDVRVGDNIGLEQFITREVQPLQAQRYQGCEYIDVGDPSGFQREQSNSDYSCERTLRMQLGANLRPAPKEWSVRRQAIKAALTRIEGDRAFVQIDRERCRALIRALRGGWRYHTDINGRALDSKPIKDKHSHPGDACGYGLLMLNGSGAVRRAIIPAVMPARLIGDWTYPGLRM